MKLENIPDFVQLTPRIATSAQPAEVQFTAIANSGYHAVVNLSMPNAKNAIKNEGFIVTSFDMSYVHIPVPFNNPHIEHLRLFIRTMDNYINQNVWVHCAKNYSVAAFIYHYLTLICGYTKKDARSSMFDKWQPDQVWQEFIDLDGKNILKRA